MVWCTTGSGPPPTLLAVLRRVLLAAAVMPASPLDLPWGMLGAVPASGWIAHLIYCRVFLNPIDWQLVMAAGALWMLVEMAFYLVRHGRDPHHGSTAALPHQSLRGPDGCTDLTRTATPLSLCQVLRVQLYTRIEKLKPAAPNPRSPRGETPS